MIKINDTLYPSKNTVIKKTLLGVNVIETSVKAEVKIGDVLNDWYHVKQIESKKGDYTSVTAEHEIYKLINIVYQDNDNYFSQFSYANVRLEELIGSTSLLQSLIPYNIVINSDVNLDAKRDIDFQDDNCLSALQKISERFNIEFIPKTNGTEMGIVIADIIGNTIPQVNVFDGINASSVSKSIDSQDVVTKVFPNGSTSGLPINYAYNNLKPNKFYAYANPDLTSYPFHGKFDDAAASFNGKIIVAEDSVIEESEISINGVSFNTNFSISTSTVLTVNSFPTDTNQLSKLSLLTTDGRLIKDIYVSQNGQKIFFNDIKWIDTTPQFFIEDSTIELHPIEKSITFSEIQPKLINGQILEFTPNVSSEWTIKVTPELIETLDLSEVQKQKSRVSFYDYSTMFSGSGFIIKNVDYVNGVLNVLPPQEEEIEKLRKNDSWLISTGDVSAKNFTFTLEDYIHVQQINDACQAVLEQGEQYLKEHKNPQITYNIDKLRTSELNIGDTVKIIDGTNWLKIDSFEITGDDNIDLSFAIDGESVASLKVGQKIEKVLKVTLTNNTSLMRSGFLEIKINGETFLTYNYSVNPSEYENIYGYVGVIVRVMEYSYNGSEYSNLVLQNFNRFKAYAYNQQDATMADIYNAKDAIKVNIQKTALKAKLQEEQWNLLIDTNFYGDYTLTEGIRIGSEDRNFVVSGLAFDENETAANFEWNKVSWTAFDFSLAINPNITASISSGSLTGLSAGNYFIYAKIEEGTEEINPDIKIDSTSVNNTIHLTTSKMNTTYDSGYYYFALGVVKLQTDSPKLYSLSYGMTYIDGGLVKARTITATEITDVLLFSGHTIKGSVLESTATENYGGADIPVSQINLDDPYFKIGKKSEDNFFEYDGSTLNFVASSTNIVSSIKDISADNKLTPNEKQIVQKEWQIIQNEKTNIETTASNYGLSSTDYTNAYNALDTYITPLLSDLTTTSSIVRATFNNNFDTYYQARNAIIENTSVKIEEDISDKVLSGKNGGSFEFRIGQNALPNESGKGIWMNAGSKFLIGENETADKMLYYDGTDFILKGGLLEATNALLWSDTDINVTVGSGGDFTTLNEALEYMSKFMIIKRADNTALKGTITILSGHEIDYQIKMWNVDLSWVTVTSVDDRVYLDVLSLPTSDYFIYCENSKCFEIDVLFSASGAISRGLIGLRLTNSSGVIHRDKGFLYFAVGVNMVAGSTIYGTDVDLRSCETGINASGSQIDFFSPDIRFTKRGAELYSGNYHFTIPDFTATNPDFCIRASQGAIVDVYYGTLATSPALYGIGVDKGAIVTTRNINNPNYNIATNTLTSDGIIFEN